MTLTLLSHFHLSHFALDVLNHLIKYADDVTLLYPQRSKTTVELEMAHVMNWATENKMTVNLLKTVEIVFTDRMYHMIYFHVQCPMSVECLLQRRALRHDLNFSQHVESVVATCNQRLYLLAQL